VRGSAPTSLRKWRARSVLQLLSDALELDSADGDGVLHAECSSRAGGDCPEELELVRVEVAAQAVEVGLVCPGGMCTCRRLGYVEFCRWPLSAASRLGNGAPG